MLSPDLVARIKACKGVYSLNDTARHFTVSKDTVHRIWHRKAHTDVQAATEAPYVKRARVPANEIREEAAWLLSAGTSVEEVAQQLGVSPNRIKREVGPSLMVIT